MAKRFPHEMPTGWFQVAYGDELAPGQVLPIRYFGKELVLFRAKDGAPHVAERHGHHLIARSIGAAVSTSAGVVQGQVEVNQHGLGLATIRFTGLVETLLVGCATAIDDEHVHLRLTILIPDLGGLMTSLVCEAFRRDVLRQLAQDIPIWENKVYLERPLLADGDGPIGVFRAWARQSYREAEAPAALTPDAGSSP